MSETRYAVTDPATGEVLRTFPTITDDELRTAIATADRAHAEDTSTVAERAERLHRVAQLYRERREDLAATIVREMAKPTTRPSPRSTLRRHPRLPGRPRQEFLADQPITLAPGSTGRAFIRKDSVGVLLGSCRGTSPRTRSPGSPARRSRRQHRPAEARPAVPGVGPGDRGDLPRGRLPHRFLHDVFATTSGRRRHRRPRVQGVPSPARPAPVPRSPRSPVGTSPRSSSNSAGRTLHPPVTDDLDAVVASAVATRLEATARSATPPSASSSSTTSTRPS